MKKFVEHYVRPIINVADLVPPAIQAGLFKDDCISLYINNLVALKTNNKSELDKFVDFKQFEIKVFIIKECWDSVFEKIKGSDVYVLFPHRENKVAELDIENKTLKLETYDYMLIPNYENDKSWLISKSMNYKRHMYCWNIPIMQTAERIFNIKLAIKNIYDLEEEYNKIYI